MQTSAGVFECSDIGVVNKDRVLLILLQACARRLPYYLEETREDK
jgi:hypothetical protein